MIRLAGLALVLVLSTACSGQAEPVEPAEDAAVPAAAPSAPIALDLPTLTPTDQGPTAQGPTAQQRKARALSRAAEKAALEAKRKKQLKQRARARAERRATALAARNPLAGRSWGVYQGPREPTSAPYAAATGATKEALAKIALRPKAAWFGAWISDAEIGADVSRYIAGTQQGDPEALVQMTIFRMVPWEHEACRRRPTEAEQASYRRWIDSFAGAVGSTPTAIVLQPDGPFALCAPGGPALPASLVAYAARTLAALPRTSVYIEVGSGDWPAPGQGGVAEVMRFLLPAGIEVARGVALNGTHYASTEVEVERGTAIVEELASRGITDKHFVVNTSSNGNPFLFGTYTGPDPDNAFVCQSPSDNRTCVTLGIPPTLDVANAAWGLSEQARADALQYADGYLWFGRPWLYRQNSPFVMQRALDLVRSTPY